MMSSNNRRNGGASMNYLRDYRVKKLMTQKELAKASGVSQATISLIENQLQQPMELTKQKLARALKISPDKLFPPKESQEHRVESSKTIPRPDEVLGTEHP